MRTAAAAAIFAGSVLATGAAQAEWSIGAGFEHFRWKESTTPQVKEDGLRWALDLSWTQTRAPGFSAGYHLHYYNGSVDYTGAGLFTGAPLSGETDYRGLVNEVQAFYRTPQLVDFMLAVGWDRWDRRLSAAQEESYDVIYLKTGVAVNAATRRGVIATTGVKYPAWIREDANFPSIGGLSNPRLRPEGDLSLYGTLGWRVNPSWDVALYYDSYRFDQSNTVAVPLAAGGTGIFFQPRSRMDAYGVRISHNF